jgi:hypothetical protein
VVLSLPETGGEYPGHTVAFEWITFVARDGQGLELPPYLPAAVCTTLR